MNQTINAEEFIRQKFIEGNIPVNSVTERRFPGEIIIIVEVSDNFERAVELANSLDSEIPDGFITVKRGEKLGTSSEAKRDRVRSVSDHRVTNLIELLNERARTSENQPSLEYVRDAATHLNVALSPRHHLVFGRRGVGKTALLVEAKKVVESKENITLWINMQSLRTLGEKKALLTIASRICDLPKKEYFGRDNPPISLEKANRISETVNSLLNSRKTEEAEIDILLPQIQQMLNIFNAESQKEIYIFLDDVHYLESKKLPDLLDMVHAFTRDNLVWLKIAGIRHQMKWFRDNPPVGMQTNHDAVPIDIDVTLEKPKDTRDFLVEILQTYIKKSDAEPLSGFLSPTAIDRLVLASGGVPRDFLTLCASSIQIARQRANARHTGVQDVNEAAGRAAQIKLQELEDDAASVSGRSQTIIDVKGVLSDFLLDEKQITFFSIDFQDKEKNPQEYSLMQSLMDLRLIHLISASVSDGHHAGRKAEVYMFDLSQFSGSRLKQKIRVLDFKQNTLTLKRTGTREQPKVGSDPRKLLGIFRLAPVFDLEKISALVKTEA